MERLADESGRQMFEASAEFLPTRLTAVEWRGSGIAVGNGGQGAGRVFLHTLLSRDKRVWRRSWPQPRDLDFDFRVLKIFGMNRYSWLKNERNRRVSSRHTRHFLLQVRKVPKRPRPNASVWLRQIPSTPQLWAALAKLALTGCEHSSLIPAQTCSVPAQAKGG